MNGIDGYNSTISDRGLESLRRSAMSNRRHTWQTAANALGRLALESCKVRDLIRQLAAENSWQTRFTALCCLQESTPKSLKLEITRKGIHDRSGEVRWKAAQQAEHFQLDELLPEIEYAIEIERSQKVRDSLKFSCGLLRDGFLSDITESGELQLTVRYSKGLSGGRYLRGEWEDKNFATLAEETRDKLESRF